MDLDGLLEKKNRGKRSVCVCVCVTQGSQLDFSLYKEFHYLIAEAAAQQTKYCEYNSY